MARERFREVQRVRTPDRCFEAQETAPGRRTMGKFLKSADDVVQLCMAVEQRFVRLLNDWLAIRHEELAPPPELNQAMFLWRTMRMRHKKAQFFHTSNELKALEHVAQWTLVMNSELRGQPVQEWNWQER